MTGTAAEVTPIREVDDRRDRAAWAGDEGAPDRVPRHVSRQERALGAVARVREGRERDARGGVSTDTSSRSALAPVHRRSARKSSFSRSCAPGGSRSGRASTASRRLLAERVGAPYVGGGLERNGRACTCSASIAGRRAGRRGDHVAALVRRLGELLPLRGRNPGVRRRRRANAEPRSRGRRSRDHADARRRSCSSTCSATPCDWMSSRRSPSATSSRSSRTPARRLARIPRPARRLARSAGGLRLLSEQTDDDRRGRCRCRPQRRGVGALEEPRQPRPDRPR